jgi:hypothetical protein
MIRSGLCSITFRSLEAVAVIDLAAAAGLAGVEWGSDVHVPAGDELVAAGVADRCHGAGLACPSYGTYVMAGRTPIDEVARVADTAVVLGASNLRVWTPFGVGPDALAEERADVVAGVAAVAVVAAERGLTASLEFHPGTLTETASSTLAVLADVDHPDLFTYWQPDPGLDDGEAVAELCRVADRLSHLHVFSWGAGFTDRHPLAAGGDLWQPALSAVSAGSPWTQAGHERWAFLEYVVDDNPANLACDAETLRSWTGAQTGAQTVAQTAARKDSHDG